MQTEENIYQQKDDLDLIDKDSDIESFNFNEEDNEYYSDYNNEEVNNDDENNDNDDDDKSDDNKSDNDESDDDDENIMQIDNETNVPNKKIIEGLKLLHLKSLYNFTESAYDDIMKIFTTNNSSLYKLKNI